MDDDATDGTVPSDGTVPADDPEPAADPGRRLADQRTAASAHVAALQRDLAGIIAASESSNADDEHDPEGATIAFERAQTAALLEQAKARLADVDAALAQLRAGTYGACMRCGGPIGAERLAARPSTRTCVSCAVLRR